MSYCNQTPFPLCKGGAWARVESGQGWGLGTRLALHHMHSCIASYVLMHSIWKANRQLSIGGCVLAHRPSYSNNGSFLYEYVTSLSGQVIVSHLPLTQFARRRAVIILTGNTKHA